MSLPITVQYQPDSDPMSVPSSPEASSMSFDGDSQSEQVDPSNFTQALDPDIHMI